MAKNLCRCGGGRAHHDNDDTCWCPRCLERTEHERCTDYQPHAPMALPPRPAPGTSPTTLGENPGDKRCPKCKHEGTIGEHILAHIRLAGIPGITATELAKEIPETPLAAIQKTLVAMASEHLTTATVVTRPDSHSPTQHWTVHSNAGSPQGKQDELWD